MRTIPELLETAIQRSAARPWLRYENSVFTYAQAHEHIASIAAALSALGVRRATRVLATTRNSPEYLFAWLGLMRLGAILLPVNPASTPSELSGVAARARPSLVITDGDLRRVVQEFVIQHLPAGVTMVLIEELAAAPHADPPAIAAREDDVAVMIPTSGTTGRSKLVMQTQRAYTMAGEGFPFWLGLDNEDRLMTSLPLFHINAPAYSVLGSVAAGAELILLPRFSASRFIEWSRRYGATEFNAIGAMLEMLMRQPAREDDPDNPVRICFTGPSPSKERQLEIERRFGFEIVCGYALSETPYGLVWPRGKRPFGTLGSPRQHPTLGEINQARVVSGERVVGVGEVGELQLKNPAVMVGYFSMPEETKRVLSDGWLSTGDLVRVNADGTFTFVARRKELIRRRGENLSPGEVESALEAHPAVLEAAVVGVPSELSEEEVKAFVVLGGDRQPSAAELRDFVAAQLAPFKVPRYFEFMRRLPHTATGRIAKHRLPRARTETEEDVGAPPRPAVKDRS